MLSNKKVAVTRKRFEIYLSNTIPLLTVYLTFEMCSSLNLLANTTMTTKMLIKITTLSEQVMFFNSLHSRICLSKMLLKITTKALSELTSKAIAV